MTLMKKLMLSVMGLGFGVLVGFVFTATAHAATFTVTSTGDDSAVAPAVGCATVLPDCTLRSAIEAANAQAGADTIDFNIAGGGVHTITPGSALPDIAEQVTIDGSTQPGASCGTLVPASLPATNTPHTLLIEVSASGIPGVNLLHFADGSSNSVLRGLVMNGISSATDVQIDSTVGGTLVECNYIGTNAAGNAGVTNNGNAIVAFVNNPGTIVQNNLLSGSQDAVVPNAVTVRNNLVGTNAAGTGAIANTFRGINMNGSQDVTIYHNVISGNAQGVAMGGGGPNNVISGNYIGLGVTGAPLGNTLAGISAFGASNFQIGGTAADQRNVISANTGDGIHIYSNCQVGQSIISTTYNNYIGTNTSGNVQSGYGNSGAGIEVNEYQGSCGSVYKHIIGGDSTGQPNVIAGNTAQGLLIHQDNNHDVFSVSAVNNSIHSNGQCGIDLAADSDTSNGIADTDLGPNPLNMLAMAYPTGVANYYLNTTTVNSATYSGNQITVNYSLQANAPQDSGDGVSLLTSDLVGYRLDFYLNDGGQDGAYAGYGQGKTHLGSFIVDGSATGATHVFTSPVTITNGQTITATTTVLWTNNPGPALVPRGCDGQTARTGDGPPYDYVGSCPN